MILVRPFCTSRRGGDRESFRESFRKNLSKKFILQIFRTHGDIENYAPLKFQPRTTLGGTKNVKKTKKKSEFFTISKLSFSSFLIDFGGARLFLTSKSSSSRFFALDGQIFRSVRPLEVIFRFFTVRTSSCGGKARVTEIPGGRSPPDPPWGARHG